MTHDVLVKEAEKVVCQLCKQEIDGIRVDGLPVAVEHNHPNGRLCEGSRIFAIPVKRKSDLKIFFPTVQKGKSPSGAGNISNLPIVKAYGFQGITKKCFGSVAVLFK